MTDLTEPRLAPEHRTTIGAAWEAAAEMTKPGQAHWADPSLGRTCRECSWWDTRRALPTGHKVAFPRDSNGALLPMKCGMARRMMFRTWGVPKVPHDAHRVPALRGGRISAAGQRRHFGWTGVKRVEFTAGDKVAIVHRARDARGQVRCEGCGRPVLKREWQIDHVISEGVARRKRKLRPGDGQLLCLTCHAKKSAIDAGALAKARRLAERQPRIAGRSEIARRWGLDQEDPPDD